MAAARWRRSTALARTIGAILVCRHLVIVIDKCCGKKTPADSKQTFRAEVGARIAKRFSGGGVFSQLSIVFACVCAVGSWDRCDGRARVSSAARGAQRRSEPVCPEGGGRKRSVFELCLRVLTRLSL